MALQSQAPRAGSSRRYAATTRRKTSLTPWLVLIGVAVIIGGLYLIFFSGETPGTNTANAAGGDGNTPGQGEPAAALGDRTNQNEAAPRSRPAGSVTIGPPASSGTDITPTRNTAERRSTDKIPGPPANPRSTGSTDSPRRLTGESKDQYELGMQRLEAGDLVAGRALLSELLFRDGALPRHEAQAVRERLTHLNEQHVFTRSKRSSEQIAADPILHMHRVQSGEFLGSIANTYRTPYQFIERVNDIDARRLQAGQRIQVLKGPVHAIVDKSDYRMDLYVLDPDGIQIYLKSYVVGLGEFDSTPLGAWKIKPGSKVGPANGGPSWRNPRTGKVYDRNDPDIPIGEYWMALEGTDENTKGKAGYGIHATNDPASIGRQESMGCIRMRDDDVDQVFYTLFEGASTVQIVP